MGTPRARILAIVPHPDDEVYPFGGSLALAARAGADVQVVALTRGDAGQDRASGLTGAALGARREAELAESCRRLGAAPPRCLGWPDGGVEGVSAEVAARALDALLAELAPDVVLTLGEDGAYGHADHVAATRLVAEAVGRLEAPPTLLQAAFPRDLWAPFRDALARRARRRILAEPPPEVLGIARSEAAVIVDVRAVADVKLAALAAHATQLPTGDPRAFLMPGLIDAMLAEEWFTWAAGPRPPEGATSLLAGLGS